MLSGGYFNSTELRSFGFGLVGDGVLVSKKVEIQDPSKVFLDNGVRIDAHVTITTGKEGKIYIGEKTHVADAVRITAAGGVKIGKYVGLASKVNIISSTDDYSGNFMVGPCVDSGLVGGTYLQTDLSDFVVIGTASTIFPGCSIGEGTAVGAMSLVNRRLPSWGIYSGIPVKFLKARSQDLKNRISNE